MRSTVKQTRSINPQLRSLTTACVYMRVCFPLSLKASTGTEHFCEDRPTLPSSPSQPNTHIPGISVGCKRAQESQQHGLDCWSLVWIEISGAARDQYNVKLEREKKKKKSAQSFSLWLLLPTEVQGLDWALTSPICHRWSTKTGKAHTDQNIRTRVQFFIQEGNLHPSLLLNQRPTCSCGGSAWIRPGFVL